MKTFSLLIFILVVSANANSASDDYHFNKGQRAQHDIQRDIHRKGPEIVAMLQLKPNMKVLDAFGGGGYYSEIISAKVGKGGSVYLHNNQAYLPWVEKELLARLEHNRLKNVIRWDKEADNLSLIDQSYDVIVFVLGYHDLYHKAKDWDINKDDFLDQLTTSLKIGGKLLIIDHSAIAGSGSKHAQNLHRIDAEFVKNELKNKGYKVIRKSEILANVKDDRMLSPFDKTIRHKTDRFVLLFEKK